MPEPQLRIERIRYTDSGFADAKRWEYEVFGRENTYTTAADDEAGEMLQYRRWEQSSEFYVGFGAESTGDPVAVLRALRWDSRLGLASFSTISDTRAFPRPAGGHADLLYPEWSRRLEQIRPDTVAELATQSVRRTHRRAGVIDQVWARFASCLAEEGVRYVTVALVVPLFEWYRLLFGEAISRIGQLLPDYVGADSIPAVIDLHAIDTSVILSKTKVTQ
ncbi:hypothetical protein AB4305_16695 [Nocardia sp. 2YAB30]|uniref:hypothetical protein n=1 Tax=unclassified Nocardia TaxID=2637762 RepID=UPI003F9494D9